jgi:hypothetical protein
MGTDGYVEFFSEDQPHLFRAGEVTKHLLGGAKVLYAGFLEVLGRNTDSG